MQKGEFDMSNFTPSLSLDTGQTATMPEVPFFSRQEVLAATTLALERVEQSVGDGSAQVNSLIGKIDLTDNLKIARYGETAQRKITSLTDEALQSALERDTRVIGILIQDAIRQIRALTSSHSAGHKLFGFLRSPRRPTDPSQDYIRVSQTLERNRRELEGWRLKLLADLKTLDNMYERLIDRHRKLIAYIRAGEKKLASFRANELNLLRQRAISTSTEEDALLYSDANAKCRSFENRLHDLALTKTVSIQIASQIQLVSNVDRQLTSAILSSTVNAIAAWQLHVASSIENQVGINSLQTYSTQLLESLEAASLVESKNAKLKLEAANDTGQTQS